MADAVTVPALTSAARVTDLIGALGIDLRTDDVDDPGVSMDYAIEQASYDVYFYLSAFDATAVSLSVWVQNNATWFAVKYLCQRRLNDVPKSVLDEVKAREEKLQLVLERKVNPGLPRSRRGAVLSNYVVRLRDPNNQIKVDRTRSTGTARDYRRPTDETAPDYR